MAALKSLITMSEKKVSKPPPVLKSSVTLMDFDDVKDVNLQASGGGLYSNSGPRQILTFTTKFQGDNVSGLVSYRYHLIIVHCCHGIIYIYDDKGSLESSVKVPGMRNPYGLCLSGAEWDTEYLVITDYHSQCLWWLTIYEKEGEVRLGEPCQHKLEYWPQGGTVDSSGQVLVTDYNNKRLYLYSHFGHEVTCIQLPQEVRPQKAVSNPAGGYVVIDQNDQLVWVNSDGQVRWNYSEKPAVCAHYLVHDGTFWLVADRTNQCVHVVTVEGGHNGYLLNPQSTHWYPKRMCVVRCRNQMWLAIWDKDQGDRSQVIELEYPLQTSLFSH